MPIFFQILRKSTHVHWMYSVPDLGGAPPKRAPHHFHVFSHSLCATCACQLVIFSKERLFVDAFNRSAQQQYFTWRTFDIVTKQLLYLLVSWKSIRYQNLVNARPSSHVGHVSLCLYSFLVCFASALLRLFNVIVQLTSERFRHQWHLK